MSANSDARKLIKAIEKEGGTVVIGGSGHYKVHIGRRLITTFPCTPSDQRGRRNLLRDLRQAGFLLEAIS